MQRPSEGAVGGAVRSPEEPRRKLGPTQSRHLHLRRCIPVAIFQPVEQVRREVRLEVKEPCGQDVAGPGPGRCPVLWILSALTRSSELCRLGEHQLERGEAGAETGPLHSATPPGQQGRGKEMQGEVDLGVTWAGAGSGDLSLDLSRPHRNAWEGEDRLGKALGGASRNWHLDKYVQNGGSDKSRCTRDRRVTQTGLCHV